MLDVPFRRPHYAAGIVLQMEVGSIQIVVLTGLQAVVISTLLIFIYDLMLTRSG